MLSVIRGFILASMSSALCLTELLWPPSSSVLSPRLMRWLTTQLKLSLWLATT